jgi:CspA family cold shock protein
MVENRNTGIVKWFNNKTGYGFITVLGNNTENPQVGKDIFVHYKSIRADGEDSNYKYLVQGEYVQFDIVRPSNEKHEFHAVDITGIQDGPTMCETRRVNALVTRERGPVVDDREFVPSRRPIRKPRSTA